MAERLWEGVFLGRTVLNGVDQAQEGLGLVDQASTISYSLSWTQMPIGLLRFPQAKLLTQILLAPVGRLL